MDSLSQIILGAACGEVVLGKKLGNKAILAGAIGGTIPDLDILANPFLTEIQGLDFHRGITHSLLFSVVAPFVVGALYHWFYRNNFPERKKYRIGITVIVAILVLFIGGIALFAAIEASNSSGAFATGIIALILYFPFLIY
ncbi:MAG: metal-dependent hydrolase, partial [Saprospiraceae bacterium]